MQTNLQQTPITSLEIKNLKLFKKGKVREVYDLGENLLFIATDRVSAFDYILPQGIPGKGEVLSSVSKFWFDFTSDIVANHYINQDPLQILPELQPYKEQLQKRSMIVKKTQAFPVECVVRGYLVGSGWKEYQKNGTVCGLNLPKGLKLANKLPEPIFTPATKAETGHDVNISFEDMKNIVGKTIGEKLKDISLALYKKASEYALSKGIIIADTKFEFGLLDNKIYLIDEVLTPDSSRFWPKDKYQIGVSPVSFDKQIVRDYLENISWNKKPPIPNLPLEIIEKTASEYQKIKNLLLN